MRFFKPAAVVYIANLSEDVWPFICEMSTQSERTFEIEENATILSDRDLFAFAGHHNTTLILPSPVEKELLTYYLNLFGNKNLSILVPKKHSGEICLDILKDDAIMSFLTTWARADKILMIPYSTSPQFIELIERLRKKGGNISTPESPDAQDAWTVNFYGSKSGIRQLAQQSGVREPDLKMADGLVSSGIVDTSRIAAKMYLKENGVVLKTNKGHSGAGVLIFRPGDLPVNFPACQKEIIRRLEPDRYWEKFPIVVEKYIQPALSVGGGYPNVEFKVHKNGKVEFLYYCGLRVTKDGVFKGILIHDDVVSDQVAAQIMDIGFYIGEHYRKEGYFGYYDVDFVASKNGELYVTESNVRRTGGTHVYQTALALIGKDFMHETYILSNNIYEFTPAKTLDFTNLCQILSSVLFNKKTREGIVITAANMLKHNKMGYIIFGNNKQKALVLEAQMEALIQS